MIEYRSQDLHADGIRLQLVSGFNEPVDVRGDDWVVPDRAGRIVGNRIGDRRILRLKGKVVAATPEAWRISTDILMAILDTTLDPGDLVLTAPYLGLASGTTATISARTLNAAGGPILAAMTFQRWDVELESVDPNWVIDTP